MNTFNKLKEEILKRAKQNNACTSEYSKAYKSENVQELIQVIKDNFFWACYNGVLDGNLIDQFQQMFNANEVWHNKSVSSGFAIASGSATVEAYGSATVNASGNATVEAYDNATVKAYDNATVKAYGSATVKAYSSATVEAYDNATVKAYGSATVEAYDNAYINCYSTVECKITGKAIIRRWDTNTIQFCSDDLNFEKI